MYVFDVGADNKADQRQALQRLHGRRRQVRAGRRALRRRRQPLVLEQRRPQRRLQRRDGVDARRASSSAASGCPRSAATSASAGPSATACSWPPASRSTRSTPPPRARRPVRRELSPASGILTRRPVALAWRAAAITSCTSRPIPAAQGPVTSRPARIRDRKYVGPSRSSAGSGGGSRVRLPAGVTSCTRPAPPARPRASSAAGGPAACPGRRRRSSRRPARRRSASSWPPAVPAPAGRRAPPPRCPRR